MKYFNGFFQNRSEKSRYVHFFLALFLIFYLKMFCKILHYTTTMLHLHAVFSFSLSSYTLIV